MTATVSVNTGTLLVRRAGTTLPPLRAQARDLLGLLVAAGPGGADLDRLADNLWHHRPPRSWESSLRRGIADLREALGSDVILTGSRVVRLALEPDDVDAWALGQDPDPLDRIADELHFDPFRWLDATDLGAEARQALFALRNNAIDQHLEQDRAIPVRVVDQLDREARADPFDVDLGQRLGRARRGAHVPEPRPAAASIEDRRPLPAWLRPTLDPVLLVPTRRRAVEQVDAALPDHPVVVVEAAPGAGITTVLAHAAASARAEGGEVLAVEGDPYADSPWFALTAGIPGFEPDVDAREDTNWEHLADCLRARAATRPIVVIVDGAHDLDPPSLRALHFVARTAEASRLTVVAGAHESLVASTWTDIRDGLARIGAVITVEPLDDTDLTHLLATLHPGRGTSLQRRAIIRRFADLADGKPATAERLMRRLDTSLTIDTATLDVLGGDGPARLAGRPARHRRVLAAVAAAGPRPPVAVVAKLVDEPTHEVLDALDELIVDELLVEEANGERVRFLHDRDRDASLRSVSTRQRRRWHAQLARDTTLDPLIRAEHARRAAEELEDAPRLELLVDAAGSALERGRPSIARELLDGLEDGRAVRLRAEGSARLGLIAEALADVRALIDLGARTDAADAIELVSTVAEIGDGHPEVLALIEDLLPDLSPGPMVDALTRRAARHGALLGGVERAEPHLAALRRATGHDATVIATTTDWFAAAWLSPDRDWRREFTLLLEADDGGHRGELLQACALEAMHLGDLDDASQWADQLAEEADASGDRRLRWHAELMAATLATGREDLERAEHHREEAARFGDRYGLPGVEAARLIQSYDAAARGGRIADWVASLDLAGQDTAGYKVFDAGLARVAWELGDLDGAAALAIEAATFGLGVDNPDTPGVLALLSPFLRSIDADLAESAARSLDRMGHRHVVGGAGVIWFGAAADHARALRGD